MGGIGLKKVSIILSLACLLFISSCGVPNMFVPEDSSVSIRRLGNGRATITINDSYLKSDQCNASYSPEVNFFYVVRGANYSSSYSSLLSKFNTEFCSAPYCNPISDKKEDGKSLVTYTSSEIDFGLYQFYGGDSLLENGYMDDGTFSMEFEYKEGEGLFLSIYNKDFTSKLREESELNRSFEGKSFNSSSALYGNELINEANAPIEVYVYASVTFTFDEYTNIWNTKLISSDYLYSFTIE